MSGAGFIAGGLHAIAGAIYCLAGAVCLVGLVIAFRRGAGQ